MFPNIFVRAPILELSFANKTLPFKSYNSRMCDFTKNNRFLAYYTLCSFTRTRCSIVIDSAIRIISVWNNIFARMGNECPVCVLFLHCNLSNMKS
jgi:hypothetical protein